MIEEGYRYSKARIGGWIVSMFLGFLFWYVVWMGVLFVFHYVHSKQPPVFHYHVRVLET